MKKIRELLRKNNYLATAKITTNGCEIDIPKSLIHQIDNVHIEFEIEDNKLNGIEYPKYCMRMLIFATILKYISQIEYHIDAMALQKGKRILSIDNFIFSLPIELERQELENEVLLSSIFPSLISSLFDDASAQMAIALNLKDGYDALKSVFIS